MIFFAAEKRIACELAIAAGADPVYRGVAPAGELQLQHAGRFKHRAVERSQLAAVGDWVVVKPAPGEASGTIETVLPRRSHFSRKVAGELTEEQVVAANIDTVFVVMGLDGDYNLRRLERYLLLSYESGASPVVLLSKADLSTDLSRAEGETKAVAQGAPVHPISVVTGQGLGEVLRHLGPGRTGALLGSSGVGKSTLINALVGEARLPTQEVRASDSRGRHTTRHRQLIVLPGGRGLLIDTPGMRELQLWDVTQSTREAFDDIAAMGAVPRYALGNLGVPRGATSAKSTATAAKPGRPEATPLDDDLDFIADREMRPVVAPPPPAARPQQRPLRMVRRHLRPAVATESTATTPTLLYLRAPIHHCSPRHPHRGSEPHAANPAVRNSASIVT